MQNLPFVTRLVNYWKEKRKNSIAYHIYLFFSRNKSAITSSLVPYLYSHIGRVLLEELSKILANKRLYLF